MRYLAAALSAALMPTAAFAGAGHGWVSGAYGCLALAPISFLATANVLSQTPSRSRATALLMAGLLVCAVTAANTYSDGLVYFFRVWRSAGAIGAAIFGAICLSWLIAC